MRFYLIGLGSNIAPQKNLPAAIRELAALGQLTSVSEVLATETVGDTYSGEFCNQLALLQCELPPPMLKHRLLSIESKLGREPKSPARKSHDRTIDLDILTVADNAAECRQAPLTEAYYRDIQQKWNQGVNV
ncbi:2-amino-4-hydroxy-6-hydroxymethyldihydropteridine diphosphokinase [Thalassolituus sp. LLYu03]|uniref:2-amino-4-hydroxy-6- hydroxymethyldihydropteridine diphosphokinase n=1 Tax=Thalassolituus sp. LLYu03 TaxID=3421656 RepID=UPI003D27D654